MTAPMPSSLEIAQEATLQPIEAIAERSGSSPTRSSPTAATRRRSRLDALERLAGRPDGKLICVTAMTPTRAGEGKTTTLGRR